MVASYTLLSSILIISPSLYFKNTSSSYSINSSFMHFIIFSSLNITFYVFYYVLSNIIIDVFVLVFSN